MITTMKNAIDLRGLRKEYKGFTLDNISLSLPMGCIMGFIGENGAGKSTTIKAMLGLIGKDSGEVLLLGKDPLKDRTVMEDIGLVLDSGFFPPEMNAKALGTALSSIYRNWDSAAFRAFLSRFEIDPAKKVKEYSRGVVMKLSLTAALSHKAKLLILDEATSGLDPIVRDDILDLLFEFIEDEQHSVFLSSHITDDLEKIADYVAFLHKGKLVLSAEKDLLLDSFGILKCSEAELQSLSPTSVTGMRKSEFGVTALVKKYELPARYQVEPASLEDIMLYSIKGKRQGKEGL